MLQSGDSINVKIRSFDNEFIHFSIASNNTIEDSAIAQSQVATYIRDFYLKQKLAITTVDSAQTPKSRVLKLVKKYRFFTNRYFQNEEKLFTKELLKLYSDTPESYQLMKQAKGAAEISVLTGFMGGFLLGRSIANAILEKEPQPQILIMGIVATITSISLQIQYNVKSKKAMHTYNKSLKSDEK